MGIYIDPAQQPLEFVKALIPRGLILLGSQLSAVPPEIFFIIKPSLYPLVTALFGIVAVAAVFIFLPWVRRDKRIAFWFVAMILAAIPEAVLLPLSKNFGYIAIAAFGLVASFIAGVFSRPGWLLERRGCKIAASIACVLLLLIHVPCALPKGLSWSRPTRSALPGQAAVPVSGQTLRTKI